MNLEELKTNKGKLILVMLAVAAVARLIPHEPNFIPFGAIALFAGTYLVNKRLAIVLPLCAMLLSDLLLEIISGNGFHATLPFVYGSYILIAMLGFALRRRVQRQTIMVASLTGSLIFFFVTNFGSWITYHDSYPFTLSGLMDCYIAGIPFFKGTVTGDLFYNLVVFGSYSLVRWKFPKLVLGN
ncbi:MAG: DUF6580 family putative transport protein [Bacteroidia bacterium]